MIRGDWTREELKLLIEAREERKKPRDIAKLLGRSRNSVAMKLHRMEQKADGLWALLSEEPQPWHPLRNRRPACIWHEWEKRQQRRAA